MTSLPTMAHGSLNATMYAMADLQRITGYSRDQLRDRVGRVWGIVAQDHRRGPKNSVLVGDKTLAVLRRLRELESRELGPNEAAKQVMEELGHGSNIATGRPKIAGHGSPELAQTPPSSSPNTSGEVAVLRELVEELRADRDHWRDLALSLKDQLALPSPRVASRRRPWWPFGRRPSSG